MTSEVTRSDVCTVAVAECFRGDGEIMASPMGTTPTLGARLAKASFAPELLLTDGLNKIVSDVLPLGTLPKNHQVEGWLPFAAVFDTLWGGKRHVMMGATQIDRYGNQNISCLGDWVKPKVQLLGARGAPGNTINHQTSYWVAKHSRRVFVENVDMVSGIGYDRVRALPEVSRRFHEIRRVVSNLGVFDFNTEDGRMRLVSVHPGVALKEVLDQTGFDLAVDNSPAITRLPTADELAMIRRLDPEGRARQEVIE